VTQQVISSTTIMRPVNGAPWEYGGKPERVDGMWLLQWEGIPPHIRQRLVVDFANSMQMTLPAAMEWLRTHRTAVPCNLIEVEFTDE
jgi:hypothetical protein